MKKSLILIVACIRIVTIIQAQKFEAGINITYQNFSRNKVEVIDAIKLYNFSAKQNGGDQLPTLQLNSKNIFTPAIWVKYKLQDGESPLSLGGEVLLKGINFSLFGEYEKLLYDGGRISVFARPRVSLGWNSQFPVSPDWKSYLTQNIPNISGKELEEGSNLFSSVSPTSLGNSLSFNCSPQIDVEYSPFESESIRLRGTIRYNWDVMTILSSRSQNGIVISVGGVFLFGE